jgi:hypothetical protein
MDGLVGSDEMQIDAEWLTASRESGVVGSFQIDAHQRQDGPQEAFRLPKRQLENKPKHQSRLDRLIGELPLPASSTGRCRLPGGGRACGEPKRDVTSLHEPAVVLGPVAHAVLRLVLGVDS